MTVAFGLLAALAAGTSDFLGGLGSRRLAALLVTTCSQFAGMVVALAMTTVIDADVVAADLMWGALAGVFGAAGLLSIYSGYATARVAITAPTSDQNQIPPWGPSKNTSNVMLTRAAAP